MHIITSPCLPCYASQVANMYVAQSTSPSSTSSPLKSKRYHVGVCCYVDDEGSRFGSSMYFGTCFEMKWFGTHAFSIFHFCCYECGYSSTFTSHSIVWTLCFHPILLFFCHVSWLFNFLLKNFMVSISIKLIFNLHIRNLTLKNLKFILNLHWKMLIYGENFYSQVSKNLHAMKIV